MGKTNVKLPIFLTVKDKTVKEKHGHITQIYVCCLP